VSVCTHQAKALRNVIINLKFLNKTGRYSVDRFAAIILACMLLCTTAVNSAVQKKEREPAARRQLPFASVEFAKDIQPILTSRCIQCHSSKNLMGGLRSIPRKPCRWLSAKSSSRERAPRAACQNDQRANEASGCR